VPWEAIPGHTQISGDVMHAINQYEEAILKSIENCAVNSFSLTAREANKASRNLKFLAEVFPLRKRRLQDVLIKSS
jgi:hypothetical protein